MPEILACAARKILAPLLLLSVAACVSPPGVYYADLPQDSWVPRLEVSSAVRSETFEFGDSEAGLAPGEAVRYHELVLSFINNGGGPFTVIVPEGGDRGNAEAHAIALKNYSLQVGLRPEELDMRIAELDGQKGPIVVSYSEYAVEAPRCGKHSANASYNPENLPAPDWGCSIYNNYAAMVSNPADIVRARIPSKADGNKSSPELEAYRLGRSPRNFAHDHDL